MLMLHRIRLKIKVDNCLVLKIIKSILQIYQLQNCFSYYLIAMVLSVETNSNNPNEITLPAVTSVSLEIRTNSVIMTGRKTEHNQRDTSATTTRR